MYQNQIERNRVMKKKLLLSLAFSVLVIPVSVQVSDDLNTSKQNQIYHKSEIILAGFLDGITDIKNSVEEVKDTIDTTNETTVDTIDTVHGINQGIGDSKKIVEGGAESQESNIVEETQLLETTESVEESNSNSF
ncbi:MAG: hypothetical protein ACFCU5_05770 [Pleurocapsa sp.]